MDAVYQLPQEVQVTEYVTGFCFDASSNNVLLIKKNRPEWQKGRLNGIGGKIEPGETPMQAMLREFEEECGNNSRDLLWRQFACRMYTSGNFVNFFYAYATHMFEPIQMTDEYVMWVNMDGPIFTSLGLDNLAWLIPHAKQLQCLRECGDLGYEEIFPSLGSK
jgi:8-oxo-dGTP diphosphatase